jgi:predicted amidohydrolase YtcJ
MALGAAWGLGGARAASAQGPRPASPAPAAGNGGGRTKGLGDLAIVNAKILTLESRQPEAQAALVRAGRIVHVGSTSEVKARAAGAPVFDARNRLVVPGFIDAHVHFEYTCLWNAYQVDCHTPPHSNIPGVLDALRAKAKQTPPGRWVIGRSSGLPRGFAEGRWPTRQEMDSVSEAHPVALMSALHVVALNTRGFRETGLWDAEAVKKMTWPGGKPRVGTAVQRDASGVPGSIVTEMWDLLGAYPVDEIIAAIRAHGVDKFVKKGITTASTMPLQINELRASQRMHAANELPLRLRVYYNMPTGVSLDALLQTGIEPGFGDDMLRFGGVKIFVTGIWNDGLGNRVEDYKWTQEELNEVVSSLHDANIQIGLHVIGDNGPIERAIRAVEYAQQRNPKPIRHRLEHASNLRELDHVRRMRKLDMRVTITRAQHRAPGATGGSPFRTFVREGLEPMAISDTTGTTPVFSPVEGIAALVAEEAGAMVGETVTFDDALRMWTLWAARGNGEEHDKGSIAVGKLGDFVVLSQDPRGRPTSELMKLGVDATILGGEVAFGG